MEVEYIDKEKVMDLNLCNFVLFLEKRYLVYRQTD